MLKRPYSLICVNWDIGTLGHWDNELKMNTLFHENN